MTTRAEIDRVMGILGRQLMLGGYREDAHAAQAGQRSTSWLAPILLAAAAGLAWLGLQRRLAEYR